MANLCSTPGCGGTHHARGMCGREYDAWRRGPGARPCDTPGCPNPRRARGYCTTCLGRLARYGDPEYDPAASVEEIAVERAVLGEPPDRMTVAEREAAVRYLHAWGWSDRRIADCLDIPFPATVGKIRRRLGLPATSPARGGRRAAAITPPLPAPATESEAA